MLAVKIIVAFVFFYFLVQVRESLRARKRVEKAYLDYLIPWK